MWMLLGYVALAGAVGGAVNAIFTDKGFAAPGKERVDGVTIYRPGWLGHVFVGAVAAAVSWGLYGPLAGYDLASPADAVRAGGAPGVAGLSLSSLMGAALVGIAGARWLNAEVDKALLRAAASRAARAQPSPAAADRIATVSPAEALSIAKDLR